MVQLVQSQGSDANAALALLGGLNSHTDGVELAYNALDLVVAKYNLSEAHLILRPDPLSAQVFVHGRRHVAPERVTELTRRPSGLYTSPDTVPIAVRDALTGCCELALSAHIARRRAAVDAPTGLSSRSFVESSVVRAAGRSSRTRWPFSLVLLTTGGPGSPTGRWQALADALRKTLRSCDEAGVAGPGRAAAILADTGPLAVQRFVERLRPALEQRQGQDVLVFAGAATAPSDSVDPDQLWRLCEERLTDTLRAAGVTELTVAGQRRSPVSEVELELRCLPGVVSVGSTGLTGSDSRARTLTVVAQQRNEGLRQAATQVATERLRDVSVAVLDADARPAPTASPPSLGAATNVSVISPISEERRVQRAMARFDNGDGERAQPAAGSAVPIGQSGSDGGAPSTSPRVVLLLSAFDPSTGASEVSLAWRGLRAIGRATGSPMTGAAQATLSAVAALGADVPYHVTSVERTTMHDGSPVVVSLVGSRGDDISDIERRLGVAGGLDESEAASRATLSALNRLLARAPTGR